MNLLDRAFSYFVYLISGTIALIMVKNMELKDSLILATFWAIIMFRMDRISEQLTKK